MSSRSLLTTKFQIPHVHSELVSRPLLMERLSQGLSHRVTLISAPAGFGKTTLLCQWIERTRPDVAWVSLDESDDDPTHFWTYVIAALQRLEGNLGSDALAMLRAPHTARVPIESVLTSLINDIDATDCSDKIVLILDDYHLIRTKSTLDSLEFFINRQPHQLHIIISTRSDPVLPLSRLRARNQIVEVRAADLRFDPAEVRQFFNEVMGLRLSAEQITALEQSSEGWIVGMQLASFSMRGRSDVSDFISSFAGSNRYILDYLVEEVLRQQPEATQSFLLQTSILDHLTAPLCDSLTLHDDGQTMLENLEKANLFISALDDERQWYRYHHLFAEFLRHHLRRTRAELVPVLQRRASEWHERNGLVPEAIAHALACQDFERAAGLIESVGRTMLLGGDIPRLLGWLDALPCELIRSRPNLWLIFAWALVVHGETHKAEEKLSELGVEACCHNSMSILGSIAAIRANIACIRRDVSKALDLSREALELLPAESLAERGAVLLEMGSTFAMKGDFTEASRTLSEAIDINRAAGNKIGSIFGLSTLVGVQIVQGRLREAASSFNRAVQYAAVSGGSLRPYASLASLSMAAISYEWNDLKAAERQALAGLEFGQQWGRPAHAALGRIHLSRLAAARGDWNTADAELQTASQLIIGSDFPDVASLVSACRLRLWTNWGKEEAAKTWIKERGLRIDDDPDHVRESEYVALAWAMTTAAVKRLETTQLSEVVSSLERMCRRAEIGARTGNLIEMLAIKSLALYVKGDTAGAMIRLDRALALAKPEGYIRTFVDLGANFACLLRHAASRGVAPNYVSTLLMAFERDVSGKQKDEAKPAEDCSTLVFVVPPAESLSERELEVLRLVADGLSNQEIAERLILAVGIVKRHIHNVFGKLGAGSRIQAVSRARELGLL